jgi:hypothetical protein
MGLVAGGFCELRSALVGQFSNEDCLLFGKRIYAKAYLELQTNLRQKV